MASFSGSFGGSFSSEPSGSTASGGSGKRYNYAPPAWWGDEPKRKKLQAQVVAVQKKIDVKRKEIDRAPDLYRMQRLIEQISGLQKKLMELLAQIDELNKGMADEEEAIVAYIAHRMLH